MTLNIHAFIFTEDFHPYKYKKYRHSCLTRFLVMALENTKGRNVTLLNVQGLWSCNVAVFYWFIVGIAYKFIISFSETYKHVISVWLLGTKMLIPIWVILLMHLWSLIFSFLGWLFFFHSATLRCLFWEIFPTFVDSASFPSLTSQLTLIWFLPTLLQWNRCNQGHKYLLPTLMDSSLSLLSPQQLILLPNSSLKRAPVTAH